MVCTWDPKTVLHDVATGRIEHSNVAYEALLKQCPVARYDAGDGFHLWGIFSHAAVGKAALDTKTFSSVTVPEGAPRILPLMADPPEHSAYARMFRNSFRPAVIAALEPQVRPIAASIIDSMVAKGSADFAQEFAYAFSTRVLCMFLRVKEDWRIYNDWSSEMEKLTKAGMQRPLMGLPTDHLMKVLPYLQELITERRKAPADDPVSGIITADIDGNKLDDQAIVGLIIAYILAGRSTTASGIGNLVLQLARDRDLQAFLRANPGRIPDAVEESLRIDTPQQEQPRKATCDVEVGGQLIKAGEAVFVNYGSANCDPERWESPGTFNIDRKPQHYAFGRGVHQCPGAPMGRMEMRVSVEELLARTQSFELAGEVRRLTWPRLSVENLPLKFVAEAAAE